MKIFRWEYQKLLKSYFLWLLLGIFLAFDIFLVWECVGSDQTYYSEMYHVVMQSGTDLNTEIITAMLDSTDETEAYYAEYVRTYDTIYNDLDLTQIRNEKIRMSVDGKPEGSYQNWLDHNYRKLQTRVHEIRETGEANAGFYPGISYKVHSKLFSNLLRAILMEILIMTAFAVLYLMDYERLHKTEHLVYSSKTGRNLLLIKCAAGTLFCFLYALILTAIPILLFFFFVPIQKLWKTPISSLMMMENRGLFLYPFITFVRLSFAEYLFFAILLLILFILLTGILSGAVQYYLRNSYFSMVCIGVGFMGLLALPYLSGWGFLHTAVMLNPAVLWYLCGGWFIEYDPSISFAWSEFWTIGIWSFISLIVLFIGKKHFNKANIS